MREWQRSQVPTEWRYGSRFSTCPRSSAQAITRAPASSCVRPARSPADLAHAPVPADGHRLGEPVVAPDVEVERVVTGRDLERSGAELAVDPLVGDDGHAELGVRDDHLATDRARVARVVRVHGDGDVGEDRRRSHRGDRDAVSSVAVRERVADRVERVVHLLVHDLEIGDGRLVERAPVHDAVRAVDPAALPEPDEERHDRADVVVVHREALARVVERAAEPAVLAHDRAARLLEPLPRPLDECVAPDVVAREPLRRERPLDDVLRRDARVVVARLPERVEAAHAVPADQHVLQGAVERVADVQPAGDVRRRHADHERSLVARAGAGRVETLGLPRLLPARLDAARVRTADPSRESLGRSSRGARQLRAAAPQGYRGQVGASRVAAHRMRVAQGRDSSAHPEPSIRAQ